ncbi:MAG: type II/IV secretion system protein [bacterium]|nr:type II/IV secretion system protein [bacterium]
MQSKTVIPANGVQRKIHKIPAPAPKKLPEKSVRKEAFTVDFVCMILKQSKIITNEHIATIKERENEQRRMLQRQYGKNSTTPITAVDVISSMRLRLSSNKKDVLTENIIMNTLASHWKLPFLKIELSKLQPSELTAKLSEPFARKHLAVPVLPSKTMLLVALVNPMDVEVLEAIKKSTKMNVRPVISTKSDILRAIERCYAEKRSEETTRKNRKNFRSFIRAATKDLPNAYASKEEPILHPGDTGQYEEKHIVKAVNSLLHYAIDQRASDIHIEPKREYSIIRLRIDGFLHEFDRIPLEVHNSFVVRLKALAGMHIAEKRKPQDGSFQANFHEKDIEFRIATMPMAFGEKIMIRPLDPTMLLQQIGGLGLAREELRIYRSLLSHNNGMILVTGPTGSGKTTTLYSTMNSLAERAINITTIEDPVELAHEGLNQIAVQPAVGLTFGTAIRHIVRQASDVIVVGEIRDQETAENAFKAALTGHLVISTLHTNDAPSTVVRLADMNVQPSLMETALLGVVSQRLVRKVCDLCGEPYRPSPGELQAMGLSEEDIAGFPIRKGFGCEQCRETGYSGRIAIFELMPITEGVKNQIHNSEAAHVIKKVAIQEGMQTLQDSAIAKFKAGITSSEEVLRVIGGFDLDLLEDEA